MAKRKKRPNPEDPYAGRVYLLFFVVLVIAVINAIALKRANDRIAEAEERLDRIEKVIIYLSQSSSKNFMFTP